MPKIGDTARGRDIGRQKDHKYIYAECVKCGERRWVRSEDGEPRADRCKRCTQGDGPNHSCWKAGNRIERGYRLVWIPKDHQYAKMLRRSAGGLRVFEHRLVMALHLGRPLETGEVVHHKDGNKLNNDINNLELTTPGKHIVDHGIGYKEGYAKGMEEGYKAGMEQAMRSINVA